MKEKLIELGYESTVKNSEFEMYVNKKIRVIILIIPRYHEDLDINKIITKMKEYPHSKRTLAFIEKNECEEDIYEDPYYFMKVKGLNKDLIPREVKHELIFEPVTNHKESKIFYNPYLSIIENVKNLLKYINTYKGHVAIKYRYPKHVKDTLYVKYFFNDILPVTLKS